MAWLALGRPDASPFRTPASARLPPMLLSLSHLFQKKKVCPVCPTCNFVPVHLSLHAGASTHPVVCLVPTDAHACGDHSCSLRLPLMWGLLRPRGRSRPVFQRKPSTRYMCAQKVHTYNNRIEISKQYLYKAGNILY
jgi:hypothetical protein